MSWGGDVALEGHYIMWVGVRRWGCLRISTILGKLMCGGYGWGIALEELLNLVSEGFHYN